MMRWKRCKSVGISLSTKPKLQHISWVNWSQGYIKNIIDKNRPLVGVTDWADRMFKAKFWAENSFKYGDEPRTPEALTPEDIERCACMVACTIMMLIIP
jgi:hypothetical protein